jgi:DNA invertase Pin-like site-specific DNA recombinase
MKAVAYIRVSSQDQVDGYSLDAQDRLFRELCKNRDWEPVSVYREEGKSAHSDSINKRPLFRQLLDDAADGKFEVVVVHTLDRWSRNAQIALESLATLAKNKVAFVSITENIDHSTAHGKLMTTMLAGFAEYFSNSLSTHIKKGVSERAMQGKHLGGIPFGYQSCWEGPKGGRQLSCEPEHTGGLHPMEQETEAVQELFRRYAIGTTTLSQLATWLNGQGFRTRNSKKIEDGSGILQGGPRLFTTASVRGILHNPFYYGKVKHLDQLLTGVHESLVSEEVFQTVQSTMKRNSGRSSTLNPHPKREYLLKGLIRCAHCLLPMWAQTYKNGNPYYREHKGSRGAGYCVDRSGSIPCEVPDKQVGHIVQAIALPEAWMDQVLAHIHLAEDVERVRHERTQTEQRLKRLGRAYVDGLYDDEGYRREKRSLEDKMANLVVPGVDPAMEAGKLLEDLPVLWEEANLSERRRLLMAMLEAVYVDTVEEKSVVAIRPKPAFRPIFEVATTREGSGIILINQTPQTRYESGASGLCFWWRRGRVELPVQKRP